MCQNPPARAFPLKIKPRLRLNRDVLRLLPRRFRHRALRLDLARDDRGRLRDPRFASFMSVANRKPVNTDFQDAVLLGRRLARRTLLVLIALGGAWVVVESAQALSVF